MDTWEPCRSWQPDRIGHFRDQSRESTNRRQPHYRTGASIRSSVERNPKCATSSAAAIWVSSSAIKHLPNSIIGNYIGTDINWHYAIKQHRLPPSSPSATTHGGAGEGESNLISGNQTGINLNGYGNRQYQGSIRVDASDKPLTTRHFHQHGAAACHRRRIELCRGNHRLKMLNHASARRH